MATLNHSRSSILIPQEICGLICQESVLGQRDYYALCTVSHALHAEAEPILHYSVQLELMGNIRSFCSKVIRRPHLLQRMHKLVLILPPQRLEPDDFSQITKMLDLSTNLRDLRILLHHSRLTQDQDEIQDWGLERHAFKLTTFVNSYIPSRYLSRLLAVQSTIKTLVVEQRLHNPTPLVLCRGLKNLSLSLRLWDFLVAPIFGGQVERLQLTLDVHMLGLAQWDHILYCIGSIGPSLKSLSLDMNSSFAGQPDLGLVIELVSVHLPHIRFLEVIADQGLPTSRFSQISSEFTQLESLILRPSVLSGDYCYSGPGLIQNEKEAIVLGIDMQKLSRAKTIMENIPLLRYFDLEVRNISYKFGRTADGCIKFLDTEASNPTPAELDSLEALEALDCAKWLNVE